jgi:hypothetical protein
MTKALWVSGQCFEPALLAWRPSGSGWIAKTRDRRYFRFDAAAAALLETVLAADQLNENNASHAAALQLLRGVLLPAGIYRLRGTADAPRRRTGRGALRWQAELVAPALVQLIARLLAPLCAPRVFAALAGGSLLGVASYGAFAWGRIGYRDMLNWAPGELAAVMLLAVLRMVWHECGHAAACYRHAGAVGGIGMGVFFVSPVMYCDVSDVHLLERRDKAKVAVAGVVFDLVFLAAALACFGAQWWMLKLYWLSVIGIALNLLPFYRNDGYWILNDLTGAHDLLSESVQAWRTGRWRAGDVLLLAFTGLCGAGLLALAWRFAIEIGPWQWHEALRTPDWFGRSALVGITLLQYAAAACTLGWTLRAALRAACVWRWRQ